MNNFVFLIFTISILSGCSQSEVNSSTTKPDKNYTIKTNAVASRDSMVKELNDLSENIQAIQYTIKMSVIELNQKQSNFEYELKKVIAESKAEGVDYRDRYKSLRNEQKEEIKLDRESIRINRGLLEDERAKYNQLLSKYNLIYGEKPTNEVERIYSGGFRNPDSNEKYDIHKKTLSDSTKEPKSTE